MISLNTYLYLLQHISMYKTQMQAYDKYCILFWHFIAASRQTNMFKILKLAHRRPVHAI